MNEQINQFNQFSFFSLLLCIDKWLTNVLQAFILLYRIWTIRHFADIQISFFLDYSAA